MSNDLVCVAADKNIEAVLEGLIHERRHALGLTAVSAEVHVHPDRDPGCYNTGAKLLAGLLADPSAKGLLVFDHAWEGNPHPTAEETEEAVRGGLTDTLRQRVEVVVIEPEIEAWVWNRSPHVQEILGWENTDVALERWLSQRGLWPTGATKPPDPKEAVERALRAQRIPRSSSLYRELARKVSLKGCNDPAFARFHTILQSWFGHT